MSSTTQFLEREKSSYERVEPRCQYFGTCGGCSLQDLAYSDQLAVKQRRLESAFAALGTVPPFELVGMDDPWRYRNKAEFTFSGVDGQLALGYHAAGSFWRVVDLEDCLLLPVRVLPILRDLLALLRATRLPAYHPRTHQGVLRHVVVRISAATEDVALCLVTAPAIREVIERVADQLLPQHPQVTGFLWGVTNRLADVAQPESLEVIRGRAVVREHIGPFRLTLEPRSFLQPSSAQADRLYRALCEAIGTDERAIMWDLYCGVGTIALYLSRQSATVYAIDSEPRHGELAEQNANDNGATNIQVRIGRVEALLMDRRFWLGEAKPEVIVVDPPRAGMQTQALSSILAARPRTLAYISCNAQSLVRDLAVLQSSFPRYRLRHVAAFDMFPQTNHVETLAILQR